MQHIVPRKARAVAPLFGTWLLGGACSRLVHVQRDWRKRPVGGNVKSQIDRLFADARNSSDVQPDPVPVLLDRTQQR
jgi:hypothetical protein